MATATNSTHLDHHHHHRRRHHDVHSQPHDQNMMMRSSPSSSSSFPAATSTYIGKENVGGDQLDQDLFLYLDGQPPPHHPHLHHHHQPHFQIHNRSTSSEGIVGDGGMRPPTLNIFPSQPMHIHPSPKGYSEGIGGSELGNSGGLKRPAEQKPPLEFSNNNNNHNKPKNQSDALPTQPSKFIKGEANRKGPTRRSEQEGIIKPLDPKTLRRLAQNREAARKSRLRKKAYVQQLESSRIRLAQLEQEVQKARAQGMFYGGNDQGIPVGVTSISSVFDLEYTRWLEEHHRLTCELRAAVQENMPENELKIYVDNCLAHYDIVMNLKNMVAKTDVFHLVSGIWKTPAERCFMWIGGFRPSELIKISVHQMEQVSEEQLIIDICGLQEYAQGTEEALTQGLEALNQSLTDVIVSDSLNCPSNMANYMTQMALAINKLSTLENFVTQADSLRQQTLHRLHQILTTRQAAKCFLGIAEYFHRLRALSSLWLSRPRSP